jgi:hypothetical protein
MIRIAALALALATGCYSFGKTTTSVKGTGASVTLDGTEPVGASIETVGGAGGWIGSLALSGRRLEREGDREPHHAAGLDVSLRLSPLGLLADHHELERYVDFGVETGAGFKVAKAPPHGVALEGEAWVGGWAELGLWSADGGYVAVTGSLRTVDATEPWLDRPTEVMIGLAWRHRDKPQRSRFFLLTPD